MSIEVQERMRRNALRLTQRMDVSIKGEWVAALRSGDYKRNVRALKFHDHYCALGVLVQLYLNGRVKTWPAAGFDRGAHNLPEEVAEWARLQRMSASRGELIVDDCPTVFVGGQAIGIVELNDNGESFDVTAKLIEEQL